MKTTTQQQKIVKLEGIVEMLKEKFQDLEDRVRYSNKN